MNGTPSYVIGDNVVVGAVGLDALQGKGQYRPLRQGELLDAARSKRVNLH